MNDFDLPALEENETPTSPQIELRLPSVTEVGPNEAFPFSLNTLVAFEG